MKARWRTRSQKSPGARDPDDVATIAEDQGCEVVAYQSQIDGSIAVRLDCPTQQAKINLLCALGRYDGWWFPDVLLQARRIVERSPADDCSRLAAIQQWVQTHIAFCDEGQETFPSALRMLLTPIGDCDDHTLLVIALASTLGYEMSCEAFPAPDPSHVAAIARVDSEWLWMETTVPARLGEHPIDACRRLGITMRDDIDG